MSALPELVDRKRLAEEMGVSRATIDTIFRLVPVVALPGLRKPMVRRADVLELIEQSTWCDDGRSVRPGLRRPA